ncbi:MAG: PEP/pyruvate-binding domain-containing protein [Anaerolineae bacterium]
MMTGNYILPFEQCDKSQHNRVGGKCASLGAMIQADAPVPPGFAVTVDSYSALLDQHGLRTRIKAEIDLIDQSSIASEAEHGEALRDMILAEPMPGDVEAAIRQAYVALCAANSTEELPVAVRSSATAEDLPGASFAGQQDTYLWVMGADAVVENVHKCWASLFTNRAIAYRHDQGFEHDQVLMAVAVQKMVNSRAAGVAMTLNPINGDRSKVVIDSSFGLGESVVAGEVTPDNFVVDKIILQPVSEKISPKHIEIVPDFANKCVVTKPVDPARQTLPSITRDELIAVAAIAKRAEKFYGTPQDVEWAIDPELEAPNNVVLLQSRPETVWTQKQAEEAANKPKKKIQTGVYGILGTLMTPTKTGVNKKK